MTEFNFRDEQRAPGLSRNKIRQSLTAKWSRHCDDDKYPSKEIVTAVVRTAQAALDDFFTGDDKETRSGVGLLKTWDLVGFRETNIRIILEGPVTVKIEVTNYLVAGYSLNYSGWTKVFIDAIAQKVGNTAESYTHVDGERLTTIQSRYSPLIEVLESSFTLSY